MGNLSGEAANSPIPNPLIANQPVVVTGVAGFIGSHVAQHLLARGQPVIGLDNFDPFYDIAIKRRNLAAIETSFASSSGAIASFRFVEGDLTDAGTAAKVVTSGVSGVIHLGAKAGVRPSIADPAGYMKANVLGTSVILEAARAAGVSRVVVASSSSVYGNAPKVPFAETDDVSRPISPYAASKRATELGCSAHNHLTGMPTACLRFFTVFGPRQRPDLAIQQFISRISAGETIRMFGDGSTCRDYTFIDDIVRGVVAAYDRIIDFRAPEDNTRFRIWNLGGSSPVSLRDMIGTIERVVGRKARIEQVSAQPGDVERTFADLSRSTVELGFRPVTRLEEGVARQWEWYRRTSGDA